eukprot:5505075-Alexandrium_andersonii.AAC.1
MITPARPSAVAVPARTTRPRIRRTTNIAIAHVPRNPSECKRNTSREVVGWRERRVGRRKGE